MANLNWGRALRASTIVLASGSAWLTEGQSPLVRALATGLLIGLALSASEWSVLRERRRRET